MCVMLVLIFPIAFLDLMLVFIFPISFLDLFGGTEEGRAVAWWWSWYWCM